VFHCHILIHEDQGMMVNVYVDDTDTVEKGIPPCYWAWKNPFTGANDYYPTPEAREAEGLGGTVHLPTGGCAQEIPPLYSA